MKYVIELLFGIAENENGPRVNGDNTFNDATISPKQLKKKSVRN
jgi:hypothetical protein